MTPIQSILAIAADYEYGSRGWELAMQALDDEGAWEFESWKAPIRLTFEGGLEGGRWCSTFEFASSVSTSGAALTMENLMAARDAMFSRR